MGIPLYYRIYRDLQYKICSGEYSPQSCLPREADLEKIYGVSRAPVRQALAALEFEGLIIRRPGKGTFVTMQRRTLPWLMATGFLRHYEESWQSLVHRTLQVNTIFPSAEIVDFLGGAYGQKVVHIIRLQSLGNDPVILLENYFSRKFNIEVFRNAGDFMSIKELLLSKFGKAMSCSQESLAVCKVPEDYVDYLQIPKEAFLLRVTRRIFDERRAPLMFTIQYVNTDKWQYEVAFQTNSQTLIATPLVSTPLRSQTGGDEK